MRQSIAHPDSNLLRYQIREVVDVAHHLQKMDPTLKIVWENIGDPVAQGWSVPPFLKDLIIEEVKKMGDKSFGYSHSRGQLTTREWVAVHVKKICPSSRLGAEDVLFTNGLGAAIGLMYKMLKPGSRVLQPTPSYPTHVSLESFNSKAAPVLYRLNPENNWQPDLAEMEEQIKANSGVSAILVINPNNPTGAVYSQETLSAIVELAAKYGLMIIADQIYFRMVYNNSEFFDLVEVAGNRVPLIVMRGMSKDVPWPGSRSGWLEFHNTDCDTDYKAYADSVKQRVLLEVCSTTLPQMVLPKVYDHPDFPAWQKQYTAELAAIATEIKDVLATTKGLHVNATNGAFYMMPWFDQGVLNDAQTLPIANTAVREYIEAAVNKPGFAADQRFTYYLLATTGICVVPASGFYSPYPGFRLTTLDRDAARRKDTYARLKAAVEQYIAS